MHSRHWKFENTVPTKRWLPPDILSIEKHSDVLPPFATAVHGLGRWCIEEHFAKAYNSLVRRYQQVVKVLPPPYISGCSQWPNIKTDAALIHAARMWIALQLVDTIQQFVDCIFSAQHNASASTRMLSAEINKFIFPNKLNRQQRQRLSSSDKVAMLVDSKIPIIYLDESAFDFVLVSGVKCKQGVLQDIELPELSSTGCQFFRDVELDDEGVRKYSPWKENDYRR